MTFGENLKALRKARGLTQEEFAKQSGISRSAIGMYESGKREPKNFEMLETIADFFNVDMNTLLGTSKAPAPPAAQPPTVPYRAELTKRDERDIEKRLQAIRDDLDSESGIALLGDHPLTEDEKEQLLIPIRSGLETARLIAKKKYTPKKYRKDGE